MSNTTIAFTATRALVPGVIPDEAISLALTLTAFDHSARVKKDVAEAYDGSRESSLYNIQDRYQCEAIEDGVVTLGDTSTAPLTPEYMEMFFRSTANGEPFTMTNLDTGATLDCQTDGGWSRNRPSASYVNKFWYSFAVREEIA